MSPLPVFEKSVTFKLVVPLVTSAFLLLAAHRRTSDWRSSLALRWPSWTRFTLWVVVYVVWMLVTNVLFHWRGPWDFSLWRHASLVHNAGRVVAVCFFGPIAEELAFRGLIFYGISKTRLGVSGAVLLTSVAWSCIHVQYNWAAILLIAVSGALLGVARISSKSLFTCISMHVLWNLYAIW